jgi:type IV pilus biogenesis protein CpaD/CtpE
MPQPPCLAEAITRRSVLAGMAAGALAGCAGRGPAPAPALPVDPAATQVLVPVSLSNNRAWEYVPPHP